MINIEGKHATAKIFAKTVDAAALEQIRELCDQSFIQGARIRVMPDTHAGKGCVIGTTMDISDKVVPNLVGVDVGCGMLITKLGIKKPTVDFSKLDDFIAGFIPHGFNIRERPHPLAGSEEYRVNQVRMPLTNPSRIRKSLGTLGGGNHFIEMNEGSDGAIYLVIHSGSRNLGKQIADYYQNKGYEELKTAAKEEIQRGLSTGIGKIDKHLAYVEGQTLEDYLHDMKIAQQFAALNRQAMANDIIDQMGWNVLERWESVHNFIDMEKKILRKGATSAQEGEKVLIPINMRDGSIIAVGKGNPEWNHSAPHGAGRLMSRSQAQKNLRLEDFEQTMAGIWSRSVVASTLDEAPMAYKPMEEILENIHDTVEILDIIKPIYNFKSR